MYPYPTLADAAPSLTYLGKLISNPSSWENGIGTHHLWVSAGYLTSITVPGEVAPLSVGTAPSADDLAGHCFALAQSSNGDAVTLVAGRSGILLKLVGALINKAVESGLAQDLIQKLLDQFIGGLVPKPAPAK